ncbi:hypothetical protein [Streptomyces sp. NPDC002685]|uniref:hypothetical protein n=1 Tax=Streptomyces sp. NPDC002685 TaxID=3154540 RepID=UPI003318C16B
MKDHVLYLGSLPPCTRATYTNWTLLDADNSSPTRFDVVSIVFLDASGLTWQRNRYGLLSKLGAGKEFSKRVVEHGSPAPGMDPIREAKLKALDPCKPT